MRQTEREPDATGDCKNDANPDAARTRIVPPEKETSDRDEQREEQKFNRQVECRGESDPDEPASTPDR